MLRKATHSSRGFTLLELMVVLVLIVILASLAAPLVTNSIQRGRESALKEDLFVMRKAIDDYYADTGSYPEDINKLLEKRYLRQIPVDPLTERRDTWREIRDDTGVVDVKSGADGRSTNEESYNEW
ncbi:MAG: prepilin-type N-terminal cleavage/methylation domain-containing protein [Gammaproteobacteria bacterium]|nr:prepilin-type N-terminal cleavage/methylation domain-containing protein [Gammaproteobacteria bacterium]